MFEIIDVSDWEEDPVNIPGQRRKYWLIHPETHRYALFKLAHYHRTESTAEKVAAEIGCVVGIPTAECDLAVRNGEYGIISYKFVLKDEALVDGGDLIIAAHPGYDRRRGREHCFQLIREVLPAGLVPSIIELLVFDALIGNSDRHQDNWSVILSPHSGQRLAPSYDHGSSLGSHISDDDIDRLEAAGIDRYVRRGRSRAGWREGSVTRQLRHIDLLERVTGEHSAAVAEALRKVFNVDMPELYAVLDLVPGEYMTPPRRALITDLLRRRMQLLKEAFGDDGN